MHGHIFETDVIITRFAGPGPTGVTGDTGNTGPTGGTGFTGETGVQNAFGSSFSLFCLQTCKTSVRSLLPFRKRIHMPHQVNQVYYLIPTTIGCPCKVLACGQTCLIWIWMIIKFSEPGPTGGTGDTGITGSTGETGVQNASSLPFCWVLLADMQTSVHSVLTFS